MDNDHVVYLTAEEEEEKILGQESPPGPSAERRRLCVTSARGLVWSINWLSGFVPKNELMTEETL